MDDYGLRWQQEKTDEPKTCDAKECESGEIPHAGPPDVQPPPDGDPGPAPKPEGECVDGEDARQWTLLRDCGKYHQCEKGMCVKEMPECRGNTVAEDCYRITGLQENCPGPG